MQFASFDVHDPLITFAGWSFSVQVITLENIYSLDAEQLHTEAQTDSLNLACSGLRWAGGQETATGGVHLHAYYHEHEVRLEISADAPHPIRAVKLLLRDLPPLLILDQLDNDRTIPDDGLLERYPNGLRLPLLFARQPDGGLLGFRCEDAQHRAKRFAAYQERFGAGSFTVECIHEEDARRFSTHIDVPAWVLSRDADIPSFRDDQLAFNEREAELMTWEARTDVPAWAREIRLVTTLHGMHWSGYSFNTYAHMLDILRYVTERIDGAQVLAYLPGWEGRYYWQYGDYRPEARLGDANGFARLCREARAMGVHLMPMFGANCVNAWQPDFPRFGPSSYMKSPTRNLFLGNQPDWDTSRAHDTGWQAWLNPGAPDWQRELTRQIEMLLDEYALDAVFLDTVEVWANDPDFNMLEGYRQLVGGLRAGRPDLLVTGEDWFDGLLPLFPIFQRTTKWRQVPQWVGRYARLMGHICDSEPSRGSTGVFESGYAPYERMPDLPFYLPTLAFVDGTLDKAKAEIDAVIALARG